MRFTLLLTVLVVASFIGCVEKGADGNETTSSSTTSDGMTATGTTTTTQTTATNTTTAPPAPACAVWLVFFEGSPVHSFGGSPPAAKWDIEVDAEGVSVRGVEITGERQNIDNEGEPIGEPTPVELRTNSQGEVTYKHEPPAQTGKFRLTIFDLDRTSPEGEDCLYDVDRNDVDDENPERNGPPAYADAQTGF